MDGTETCARRIPSLDALRGFVMLFIIGLSQLICAVSQAYMPPELSRAVVRQLQHMPWVGVTPYDLIFPLFVFISGVSASLSQSRAEAQGISRLSSVWKLVKRAAFFIGLGVLINLDMLWGWQNLRYASALGLIGISGLLAGCLSMVLRRWWQRAAAAAGILLVVGVAQYTCGTYMPTGCLNAKVDALLCPGRLYLGVVDPAGPLCIVSATALVLLGMAAGRLVAIPSRLRSCGWALGVGVGALAVSMLCGPVIMTMWTPSFVLIGAAWGCMLLGIFRLLSDGTRGALVALPLRIVGANALAVYAFTHLINYRAAIGNLTQFLARKGWIASTPITQAAMCLLVAYLFCLYLRRLSPTAKL